MPRGWFGNGGCGSGRRGLWPGRGPFSHLPPWERPGWLYGRGACRRPLNLNFQGRWLSGYVAGMHSSYPPTTKEREEENLKAEELALERELEEIKARLKELEK